MEKLACFGGPGSYSHLAALQQDDIVGGDCLL